VRDARSRSVGRAMAAVDDRTVCFVWGTVRAWRQPARRIVELMHVSPCAGGSWRPHLLVRPNLSISKEVEIRRD
jgi:hypothetical protein